MTRIFDLPYCTNDLRHYLKPLPTTNELFRLKQYFYYQKNLAMRLINYQRLLTSNYNHKLFNIHPNTINKRQINSPLESQTPVSSIDHTQPPIRNIDTPIIKLNTCSTLIATGHGIAKRISSLMDTDTEQLNHGAIDEDISLSRTCKKILR